MSQTDGIGYSSDGADLSSYCISRFDDSSAPVSWMFMCTSKRRSRDIMAATAEEDEVRHCR